MKLEEIIKNKDFENARIIVYFILLISYIYFEYFSNLQCVGCPLCGMTRAVKCILMLNINKALEYNELSFIFCIIIPLIFIDIINIIYKNSIIINNSKILK